MEHKIRAAWHEIDFPISEHKAGLKLPAKQARAQYIQANRINNYESIKSRPTGQPSNQLHGEIETYHSIRPTTNQPLMLIKSDWY